MKIRTKTNSLIPSLLGVDAITLYPFILYRDKQPTDRIVRHEWIHVSQIREHGVVRFYFMYMVYYARNRCKGMSHDNAYRNIPYEIEAYKGEKG